MQALTIPSIRLFIFITEDNRLANPSAAHMRPMPISADKADAMETSVLGMQSTFKGIGVVFDVYDNDNQRDNPHVFVLENFEGKDVKWDHGGDFKDDWCELIFKHLHMCVCVLCQFVSCELFCLFRKQRREMGPRRRFQR
jgi:hypothetical protein